MSVKEWLLRAWKIDNEITALERELFSARERMLSVTAHYSDIKAQTSQGNAVEIASVNYIEYKDQLMERIDNFFAIKREVAHAMSKIGDSACRTLLELRYLQYLTWERIAEEMNLSDKWIRTKLHSKALNAMEDVLFLTNFQ